VYRFLLSRQWVILTLAALLLIPAMIELGFWQLHRHQARVAHNQLVADSLAAKPVPVGKLTAPGREPAEDDRYRAVVATGWYDAGHEVVVRRRTAADGRAIGCFVLTPLVRADGSAVLVNRGWIPAGEDQTSFPEVPATPGGKVTVTGRLLPDETTADSGIKDRSGLPDRQVMLINSEQRAKSLDRPVLGGFIELTGTEPEPAAAQLAQPVPEPDHSGIGAHMAYAVQWWLFAAAVPAGWVVLVRRELRDRAGQERPAAGGDPAGPPLVVPAGRTAD
jgi:cytochrome oxidase assembly protein ShyY1